MVCCGEIGWQRTDETAHTPYEQGAVVTGIELAEPWDIYAVQRERAERLGIRYVQGAGTLLCLGRPCEHL